MYNVKKQHASIHMMSALLSAQVAYYAEDSKLNLEALQACREAMDEMLKPYYLTKQEEEKHG